MIKYDYFCATSIQEACELLSKYNTDVKVIAGGTDLMVQFRDEDKRYRDIKYVVDISHIKEMNFIKEDGERIIIGAAITHDDIQKSQLLKKYAPFLCNAAATVGSPQIRNRGTVGGNICNSSPAADTVPPLIALDAELKIESIRGARVVPIKSIYVKANQNNLAADEIVTEIRFKKLPEGSKTSFIKLGRRKALAISRINVAVTAKCNLEGRVEDIRIYPGCIFGVPERVTAAEEILIGKLPTVELINEAGLKVSEEMITKTGIRWSTEYKKPAVEALIRRGLKEVLGVE